MNFNFAKNAAITTLTVMAVVYLMGRTTAGRTVVNTVFTPAA